MLEGDPAYLERLVLNLASNAVKFTGAGGEVEATLRVTGEVAELSVSDTGMGIPLEEQARLFQKFFRSSLATEHAIQGTGLGCTSCARSPRRTTARSASSRLPARVRRSGSPCRWSDDSGRRTDGPG